MTKKLIYLVLFLALISSTYAIYLPSECTGIGTGATQCIAWNDGTNQTGVGLTIYTDRGTLPTPSGGVFDWSNIGADTNAGWDLGSAQTSTFTTEFDVKIPTGGSMTSGALLATVPSYITQDEWGRMVGTTTYERLYYQSESANYVTVGTTVDTWYRVIITHDYTTSKLNYSIYNYTVQALGGTFTDLPRWKTNNPRYLEFYGRTNGYVFQLANITIYSGSPRNGSIPPVSANFTITAGNGTSSSMLYSYTASINGSTYNSDGGGQINTTLARSNGGIYTLDIDSFGFYNYSANVNISSNWRANLTQFSLTYLNSSPENDTQYNYTSIEFSIDVEYNGTPISTNCLLILNNASAGSESSDVTNGTFSPGFPATASNGINYYYWSCINDYFNLTTAPRTFYVDTTFPTITTNFINNSIYYLSNITASINFTDDQTIFMYNVSIDGIVKGLRYNNGTSNNDTYNLNENPQWLGIGQHLLSVITADGHTKNYIEPFDKISKGLFNDVIEFKDDSKKIKIQAKDKTLSDKWEATKLTDRYSFAYEPSKKSSDKTFIVDCDDELFILTNPNTEYKQWLVCGNKWIDFKIPNENPQISIKRNSKNQAEVSLKGIKDISKIQFNSIGELNTYEAEYYFSVINATTQQIDTAIETQMVSFNLTINKTESSFTSSASFNYNNTFRTITKTSNGIYDYYTTSLNVPFQNNLSQQVYWAWNFTLSTIAANINSTQTVQQIFLSNCTGQVNITGINFTIYQEATTSRLDSNTTLLITAYYNEPTLQKAFNFTIYNVNNFSICSYGTQNINLNYNTEVSKAGYYTRRYEEVNKLINQTTQFKFIYLLPTTASSVVTQLIDQLNNRLVNQTITMERFDFPTSSHQIVQSEKSDINGNSLFYYDANTKYRFLIYNISGGLIFNTNDMVITQNPTIIKVTSGLLNDLMDKPISAWQIKSNLYNISTMIYFEWLTLNGYGTICMNVTYSNVTAWQTINSECSSAESGTMTYNFSAYNNGTIRAITYAVGSTNIIGALDIALGYVQRFFEAVTYKDNYVLYLLLILAGALLGLTNVVVIPWIIGVIHILCWMIGIIPVTFGLAGVPFIIALIIIMTRLK